ncbi:MAG: peptidoglycan recognition family protein [Candidatus Pacearchaeota archaeon]
MRQHKSLILPTTIIKITISIIILVALIFFGKRLIDSIITSREETQAQSLLQSIKNRLENTISEYDENLIIYAPLNWDVVFFPKELNFINGKRKPEIYELYDVLCLCKGNKCKYCIVVNKKILDEKNKYFKLTIKKPILLEIKKEEDRFIFLLGEIEEKEIKIETNPNLEFDSTYFGKYPHRKVEKREIKYIIFHHTGGNSIQGALQNFKDKGLSSHYIIDKDGKIYYIIDEKYIAYHAKDYNDVSIGIEIVNSGCEEFTPEQYNSLKKLVNDINGRYKNLQILGHFEINQHKWDPSPIFNWSELGLEEKYKKYSQNQIKYAFEECKKDKILALSPASQEIKEYWKQII